MNPPGWRCCWTFPVCFYVNFVYCNMKRGAGGSRLDLGLIFIADPSGLHMIDYLDINFSVPFLCSGKNMHSLQPRETRVKCCFSTGRMRYWLESLGGRFLCEGDSNSNSAPHWPRRAQMPPAMFGTYPGVLFQISVTCTTRLRTSLLSRYIYSLMYN